MTINKFLQLTINTSLILLALIPFLGGIYYSAFEITGAFATIGGVILGFSGTLFFLGLFAELRGYKWTGVLCFIGIFLAFIAGFFLLVGYLIK